MIRFTWHRFRTQALVALGALAVLAVVLAITGIQLAHAYDAAVAACRPRGACASGPGSALNFPSSSELSLANTLNALVVAIPGLTGMFWGAPLIAREFETGSFRLAWTQGVTRTRWLAVKLGVTGVASTVAAGLLSLMVAWWSSPIAAVHGGRLSSFHSSGVAPIGYAAFAFALGAAAGLLIRRTLPAIAVTLAVFAAVTFAFPMWVRPHLIPPVQATVTLSAASINGFEFSPDHRALLVQTAPPDIPGAWILSSQLTTPDGRPASAVPVTAACGPNAQGNSCQAYIESLHLRQAVTYQPASRYWPLQWYESGIYLAVALALAGFCLWWIHPGRSAEPDIHRPRASQPASILERSP
ncbi:MAG TPA: ABC transporter permease [Streptosporangiaceae bacterium]|nr:ABC transporter permease [Streptosporangiaceae bacterium]